MIPMIRLGYHDEVDLEQHLAYFKEVAEGSDCLFFIVYWYPPIGAYRMMALKGDTSHEDLAELCRQAKPEILDQELTGDFYVYRRIDGEWQRQFHGLHVGPREP